MCKSSIEIIHEIAFEVNKRGGCAYYVGGYVRDKLLGNMCDDIDIEIHGLTAETIRDILYNITPFSEVGKSFGIFTLSRYNIDIALPRTEKQTGIGHRNFEVNVSPFLGTYMAASRRDFTINSMMENVLTGELVDHFNGYNDLMNSIIRHVNDNSFPEDPLRVLRAAQFAARLGFVIHESTIELSRKINIASLSRERVFNETKKALLKAEKPSIYFRELHKMNALTVWFSGLEKSFAFIDAAAKLRKKANHPIKFMLSAIAITLPDEYDVECFVGKLTNDVSLTKFVLNMYRQYSEAKSMTESKTDYLSTNILFDGSTCAHDLVLLLKTKGAKLDFMEQRFNHYKDLIKNPRVSGKDLISVGFVPSSEFARLKKDADLLFLQGKNRDEIIEILLAEKRKSEN